MRQALFTNPDGTVLVTLWATTDNHHVMGTMATRPTKDHIWSPPVELTQTDDSGQPEVWLVMQETGILEG